MAVDAHRPSSLALTSTSRSLLTSLVGPPRWLTVFPPKSVLGFRRAECSSSETNAEPSWRPDQHRDPLVDSAFSRSHRSAGGRIAQALAWFCASLEPGSRSGPSLRRAGAVLDPPKSAPRRSLNGLPGTELPRARAPRAPDSARPPERASEADWHRMRLIRISCRADLQRALRADRSRWGPTKPGSPAASPYSTSSTKCPVVIARPTMGAAIHESGGSRWARTMWKASGRRCGGLATPNHDDRVCMILMLGAWRSMSACTSADDKDYSLDGYTRRVQSERVRDVQDACVQNGPFNDDKTMTG